MGKVRGSRGTDSGTDDRTFMLHHLDDETWNQSQRGESELQRLDRNLTELVGELRVIQTGVQVLFAFLLAVPFTVRFDQVDGFGRGIFVMTLLCAAIACAFLTAPAACHRLLFRRRDKHYLVRFANQMALAGLGFVAVAMSGAVLLVMSQIMPPAAAVAVTAAIAVIFAVLWLVVPLQRRRTLRGEAVGLHAVNQDGP